MEYLHFLESLRDSDPELIGVVESGYMNTFETITEPMTFLKRNVSRDDKSLGTRLAPYLKATNKSTKQATDELDLIRNEWSWFGEKFVEDGAELDLGDDYPYDIDYESIDMDAIMQQIVNMVLQAVCQEINQVTGSVTGSLNTYTNGINSTVGGVTNTQGGVGGICTSVGSILSSGSNGYQGLSAGSTLTGMINGSTNSVSGVATQAGNTVNNATTTGSTIVDKVNSVSPFGSQ